MRILICEDRADTREMLGDLLRVLGYDVVEAATGAAALEHLLAGAIHTAFIDIGLPDINGLEVARRTIAAGLAAEPYLVALTGYGSAADRASVTEAGFDRHLLKPVPRESLLAAINRE
jgi:two-component system, sensor histidine kinase